MERRIFIAAMIILTAAFAVSCTEDVEVNNINGNGEITFNVSKTADWQQTEGSETVTRTVVMDSDNDKQLALTTTVEKNFDGNTATRGIATTVMPTTFDISAYTYTGGTTPTWVPYFTGETAQQNGSVWEIANAQYWPNATDFLRFYGYAPISGAGISYISGSGSNAPQIDFTVQNTVANQIDLMTSSTGALRYKSGIEVEMPFRHALTCVKVAIGTGLANCTIKEVTLKRIVSHATYDFDNGWTSGTAAADTTDFELAGIGFSSASAGTQIVYDEPKGGASALTFLMIPQTFNKQEQMVEVVFNTGSGPDITAQATLQGSTWLAGTIVTYKLSMVGEYDYVLTATPITTSYEGGVSSFSVTSYRQAGANAPEPLDWRIIGYSTDGVNFSTTKPNSCSWAAFHTVNGLGGTSPEECKVSIAAQTKVATLPTGATDDASVMAYYMARYDERSSDEDHPYDLSTHDFAGNETSQNTANSYVINAPGWYKLPLVYGNAVRNGGPNNEAYTAAGSATYPDHAGTAITQPYIYTNYTPASATLIWQDAQDLINPTSVSLCDLNDNGKYTYLKFYVSPNKITQGNAIVAVKDASNIMWSWHIWVTDVDITRTVPIVNYSNKTFELMPVDLGWCSTGSNGDFYTERIIYVKILQDGGQTAILKIRQAGSSVLHSETGYAPYYQAGRKDPMQPGTGINNNNRTVYGSYQPDYTTVTQQTIPWSIQNPHKYVAWSGNWVSWRTDLWCGANTTSSENSIKIKKTIYDPCPVGFHIPENQTFTGVTNDGYSRSNTTAATLLTGIKAASWSNGYYFYTKNGGTVHIPAIGVRDNTAARGGSQLNASIVQFGWYANRWTAIPLHATDNCHYLFVTEKDSNKPNAYDWINPYGADYTANGNAIRPVADY